MHIQPDMSSPLAKLLYIDVGYPHPSSALALVLSSFVCFVLVLGFFFFWLVGWFFITKPLSLYQYRWLNARGMVATQGICLRVNCELTSIMALNGVKLWVVIKDGNGGKSESLKMGARVPQKAPGGVQGQRPRWGSGGEARPVYPHRWKIVHSQSKSVRLKFKCVEHFQS